MTIQTPIAAASIALWTDHPEAVALLANCAINPPAIERHQTTYAITRDEWFEYTGHRAERLKEIWGEHILSLADGPQCFEERHAAIGAQPTVTQAIDNAICAEEQNDLGDLIRSIADVTFAPFDSKADTLAADIAAFNSRSADHLEAGA